MLVVILSWVSFWINVEATPARVSLGLLTVLSTTTMMTGLNQNMPRVSYIKAIDIWMSACLIFVFAGLLEFALVNVMSRKQTKAMQKKHKRPHPPPPPSPIRRDLEQGQRLGLGVRTVYSLPPFGQKKARRAHARHTVLLLVNGAKFLKSFSRCCCCVYV